MTITVKERGWAGHFCASASCQYRRNTLVSDGERHIIVSTVGNYRNPALDGGLAQQIGFNRYYETMVFAGEQQGPYIDANVAQQFFCNHGLTRGIYGERPSDLPEGADNIADDQHNAIVEWYVNNFNAAWESLNDKD